VTSWTLAATWLPIFTSITLLATINIAPGVMEFLTTLGTIFSRLREMETRSRTPREQEIDPEQGQSLLQEMIEHPHVRPNVGYQGSEDIGFTVGHMSDHPHVEESAFR